MTTKEDKLNAGYEKFIKLYLHNKSEGIYSLLSKNPEVMRYMTMEEKAGIAETILRHSNEMIKNLESRLDHARYIPGGLN
jgi:hypothetical protein